MDRLEQENKYYTPDISEFHVGFEYELYTYTDRSMDWVDTVFEGICAKKSNGTYKFSVEELEELIKNEDIKVKFLDQEDIESLGFAAVGSRYTKLLPVEEDSKINRRELWIDVLGENTYKIYEFNHEGFSGGEEVLFKGTIKNKSEFKRILKQLGIL